jgi:hypothetical protein
MSTDTIALSNLIALIILAVVQQYGLYRTRAEAAKAKEAADIAAASAEEQKKLLGIVHDLGNSNLQVTLQSAVGFAKRIYERDKFPEDLIILEQTQKALQDHISKQAVVDLKKTQ